MMEANGSDLSFRDIAAESSIEEQGFSPDRMCRASLMVAEQAMRDNGIVPVICPTCQIVFAGEASMPANPFVCIGFLSLHGVVFDILVGTGSAASPAAAFRR
jgi:hypothetical protein